MKIIKFVFLVLVGLSRSLFASEELLRKQDERLKEILTHLITKAESHVGRPTTPYHIDEVYYGDLSYDRPLLAVRSILWFSDKNPIMHEVASVASPFDLKVSFKRDNKTLECGFYRREN